jgi:hypothetical protein
MSIPKGKTIAFEKSGTQFYDTMALTIKKLSLRQFELSQTAEHTTSGITKRLTDVIGGATTYDKANDRLMQLAAHFVHDGYTLLSETYEYEEGDLREEVLELLREAYPIGCEVEIIDSEVPRQVGLRGKLLEITNSGAFVIKHPSTQFKWGRNTFRKISE